MPAGVAQDWAPLIDNTHIYQGNTMNRMSLRLGYRLNCRITGACALLLLAPGLGTPALAFDIPPPPPPLYQGLILPLFPNGSTIPFSGQSGGGGKRSKAASSKQIATLATGSPQTQSNARQLAQAVPAEQREQMTQVYLQAYDTWRQLERKLGLPADDAASAVAAFIAGNYMAYRDTEVPDAAYLRLVHQMRSALAGSEAFARSSPADKRKLYERMAMVGTFMAVARLSLQKQPNATAQSNFRNAAAANLEMALKVPADQVRIGDKGLALH